MRSTKKFGLRGVSIAVSVALVLPFLGCGNDFLGLEDYQRDLLVGGLAAALLLNPPADDGGDETAGQPIPGPEGSQGPEGEQGVPGPEGPAGPEGPQGPAGAEGVEGPAGPQGPAGSAGLTCWDLNGNGVADLDEDTNGDGEVDVRDCKGADGAAGGSGSPGPAGPPGPEGPEGPPGPEYFDIFIDDFFAADYTRPGDLLIVAVRIDEPVIGYPDPRTGETGAIAYRVAIPDSYGPGNDVTMRMFIYRTGPIDDNCFVFSLDSRRLRDESGVEVYEDTVWVRIDMEGLGGGQGGLLLVLDLPINTAACLDPQIDLAARDFLAFEITTHPDWFDQGLYQLLGVEFFEYAAGTATVENATVFFDEDDIECPPAEWPDCNDNGVDDAVDIAEGTSQDCNDNTVPDECDIAEGTSEDCQPNGIPDECDLAGGSVPRGAGARNGLMFPLDGTYELVDFYGDGCTGSGCAGGPDQHNDDDSATVPMPFAFDLYGDTFTTTYVNNNGNVSFGSYFPTYDPEGFPVADFPMVAPFWGDVDTGNPNHHVGDVWMKFFDGNTDGSDETLVVTWDNVGYFNENGDKRNTFQLAMSDGTNPDMGIGNNVCFAYETMGWTTGDASGGSGGFGGYPATVGANAGNGTDYFQIGRFDHAGDDYDGPGGNPDGVYYLNGKQYCFNTSTETFNIAPIPANFPPGNTVTVSAFSGGVVDLDLQFLSPEIGQTTTVTHDVVVVDGPGVPAGLEIVHTSGNVALVDVDWTPHCGDAGTYDVEFTATDDFDPPGVTEVTLTIIVTCEGSLDCNENDVPDECDIAVEDGGYCDVEPCSSDCQGNGVPDECEMGEPPSHNCCETGHGAGCSDEAIESCVCDGDLYCCDGEWDSDCVEEVESFGCGSCAIDNDCNGNGMLDECDIAGNTSSDCNDNAVPDECDIEEGTSQDCNGNDIPDECDIEEGTSEDCQPNGIPDECEVSVVRQIRVAQESAPGEGDFDDNILGYIKPHQTTQSAAGYYRYALGYAASFNGTTFELTYERSHLFLVDATDGLSFFVVHDRPENQDGGSANTRYELSGDPDGAVISVQDDPTSDAYTGGPTEFEADHAWSPCCTDGLALTGLDGDWSMIMEFTQSATGLADGWAAYSPGEAPIMLELVAGRRVRVDVWHEPGAGDCNGNGIPDECDIAEGTSDDCQPNSIPDECDIEYGTSEDTNGNGIPDECEDVCVYELCAGEATGSFSIDGWEGDLMGTLAPDGAISLDGPDLLLVGMVECGGTMSWIVEPYSFTLQGQMYSDDGCYATGVFMNTAGEQIGSWGITLVVD